VTTVWTTAARWMGAEEKKAKQRPQYRVWFGVDTRAPIIKTLFPRVGTGGSAKTDYLVLKDSRIALHQQHKKFATTVSPRGER